VTTAYAFTDHRSQGKTLPVVVVDIATLPTGGLTLFNVYMARSPKSALHCLELLTENDGLEKLNEAALQWWKR
ncbi:hypothetical protein J3A83DRAFT_4054784, partial [Scleroderma citrinum]